MEDMKKQEAEKNQERPFQALHFYCLTRDKEILCALLRLHARDGFLSQALRNQIVGDIHLAFGTVSEACLAYETAAALHAQGMAYQEAAAIYRHLLTINPQSEEYREKLDAQMKLHMRSIAPHGGLE